MVFDILKNTKKYLPFVLITIVLFVFAIALIFAYTNNSTIQKGVKIEGVDVSGRKIEEARYIISEAINNKYGDCPLILKYGDKEWRYGIDAVSYEFLLDDAVKKAYYTGKSGSFFERIFNQLKILASGSDIKIETHIDEIKLKNILKKIKLEIDDGPQNASISYNKDKITINKHLSGHRLDIDKNAKLIENQIKNKAFDNIMLNVESIAPKIKYEDINEIDSVVSSFYTIFSLNDKNRGDNIRLACKRINGILLMPNEKFSMNEALGPRTLENGYKEAPVIFQNELVKGTGGGICQVTTTLYNAVLKAKLKVLERSHHSMPLGYVKPGQDATIAGGSIDLKFQNSNNYPVYLNAEVIGGKIEMRLLGKSSSVKEIVKLHSEVIETVSPGEDEVETDDTLADGEMIIVRKPKNGIRAVLYRYTYNANNVLEDKEKISEDYYKPVKGLIRINSNYVKTGVVKSE